MTVWKGTIRLSKEAYDIIKWFTLNYNNEIGALGTAELIDGELYVEKLFFPKQIVNSVHVHFKPEDWPYNEMTADEMGKILFYWHKHPGCSATPSGGDEKDTFDVFMPEEDNERPYFGFLITAHNATKDGMVYTARIELRQPIWATIENCRLATEEDDGVEDICREILATKVTVGNASSYNQPGVDGTKTPYAPVKPWQDIRTPSFVDNYAPPTTTAQNNKPAEASAFEEGLTFDVALKNGAIVVAMSDFFKEWMDQVIEDDLHDTIQRVSIDTEKAGIGVLTYVITPRKKQIDNVYASFQEMQASVFGETITNKYVDQSLDDMIGQDLGIKDYGRGSGKYD